MVNELAKNMGVSLTVSGLKMIRSGYEYNPTVVSFGVFKDAFNKVGLYNVRTTEQDTQYHISDWDTYSDCLRTAYKIVSNFPWKKEWFDCDNRSAMMSVLLSIFGLTLGRTYGEVFDATTGKSKYLHWSNVIVDTKGDLYLFDQDNGGQSIKVERGKDIVIGNCRYKIIQAIFN